ncbi:hypothetical protein SAMN05421678_11620 [Actinopolymorpha cephalotaxi]|uniref:Uncharacterized protein n=1 Tax=Actinopolymorpha cephalotaxi TaxID=504797 RepID=A0A1I2ZD08_9ACTN|nr:hypothetical protein [Actinopolymorpha cephalotaxi]NYH81907.1 hypothetical protein [Actinopolymorpha cephalotaxi]SFH35439.1 hypothetical protein SAMN05421678_11620 [Actinopolymorpha cephalotaxi]
MNRLHEDLARARIQARLDAGRAHRQAAEARRSRRRNREKRKLTLRALLVRFLTSDRDVPANVPD